MLKVTLSELSDSIVGLIDYGVRAWLFGVPLVMLLMVSNSMDIISLAFTVVSLFSILFLMLGIWVYDARQGYVPNWWLRLSYTNQFWANKNPLPKRSI